MHSLVNLRVGSDLKLMFETHRCRRMQRNAESMGRNKTTLGRLRLSQYYNNNIIGKSCKIQKWSWLRLSLSMIPTFRPLLVLFIIPTICSKSLISFLPAMVAHCTDYQWLPIGTMATSTQHDTHHVMSQFSLGQQIFLNVAKNTYSLLKHLGVGNKDLNECFRKKTER